MVAKLAPGRVHFKSGLACFSLSTIQKLYILIILFRKNFQVQVKYLLLIFLGYSLYFALFPGSRVRAVFICPVKHKNYDNPEEPPSKHIDGAMHIRKSNFSDL